MDLNPVQPPALWTVDDLSAFLRRTKSSIYSDSRRNPASLPPGFKIPGAQRWLWHPGRVLEWLEAIAVPAVPATVSPAQAEEKKPLRRGRPTKAEQLARAAGGAA